MKWLRVPGGRWIRGTIVSVISVALIWALWKSLGSSAHFVGVRWNWGAAALAVGGVVLFLVARAWRFVVLLPSHRPQLRRVLGVSGAAWGIGLLLPGPSADAAFVALAKPHLGISYGRGTGISLLARVLDVLSLAAVIVISALVSSAAEPDGAVLLAAIAGVGAVLFCGLVLIPRTRRVLLALLRRLPRVGGLAGRADAALRELARPRLLLMLGLSTVACRIATAAEYSGFVVLLGLHLTFWQVWFALAIRTFLSTIPIQGVAGIGTSQVWWGSALVLEGVPVATAIGASITLQFMDMAVSLPLAGICYLALRRMRKPVPVLDEDDDTGVPAPTAEVVGRLVANGR